MILIALALLLPSVFNIFHKNVTVSYIFPMKNKTIVIDPGHGGIDPGASSKSGVREDKINLQISIKLKKLIEQSGGRAILTRENDKGLYTEGSAKIKDKKNEDFKNRNEIINNSKADIFLTIHLNHFSQSKYYGAQTFYQKGEEESKKLAEFIQEELKATIDNKNHRMAKSTDSIFILKNKTMPSALVECGFLSNPEEEKLLQDDKYQDKIAWGIFMGIVKYLGQEP